MNIQRKCWSVGLWHPIGMYFIPLDHFDTFDDADDFYLRLPEEYHRICDIRKIGE